MPTFQVLRRLPAIPRACGVCFIQLSWGNALEEFGTALSVLPKLIPINNLMYARNAFTADYFRNIQSLLPNDSLWNSSCYSIALEKPNIDIPSTSAGAHFFLDYFLGVIHDHPVFLFYRPTDWGHLPRLFQRVRGEQEISFCLFDPFW